MTEASGLPLHLRLWLVLNAQLAEDLAGLVTAPSLLPSKGVNAHGLTSGDDDCILKGADLAKDILTTRYETVHRWGLGRGGAATPVVLLVHGVARAQ